MTDTIGEYILSRARQSVFTILASSLVSDIKIVDGNLEIVWTNNGFHSVALELIHMN